MEEQSCVNKVNTDNQTTSCVKSEARSVIIDEVFIIMCGLILEPAPPLKSIQMYAPIKEVTCSNIAKDVCKTTIAVNYKEQCL